MLQQTLRPLGPLCRWRGDAREPANTGLKVSVMERTRQDGAGVGKPPGNSALGDARSHAVSGARKGRVLGYSPGPRCLCRAPLPLAGVSERRAHVQRGVTWVVKGQGKPSPLVILGTAATY